MTDGNDSIEQSLSSVTTSWLRSAQAGEDAAWQRLVKVYSNLIAWWCRKSGIPAQDVEDVLQDVLAAVARSLPSYEHESFRGFLWSITSNKVKDYWRNWHRRAQSGGGGDVQEILDNIEAESKSSIGSVDVATKLIFDSVVQLVRGEFSERDWQVFWDYAVEAKDARSVAESHGVTRNQVFLAKSRILRRIRSEFNHQQRDL